MSIQQTLNTLRYPVSNHPEKSPFNAGETLQEKISPMTVLLLGSGGRECALAWKISQSPALRHLYIAPGNGGTGNYGENVNLSPLDFDAIAKFSDEKSIDMIVVGNEDPLVAGIYDYFQGREHAPLIVGPSKAGAALEGSKDFAKQFMVRHGIPTARYRSFTAETIAEGEKFLEELRPVCTEGRRARSRKGCAHNRLSRRSEELTSRDAFRHVWEVISHSRDRRIP